MFDDILGSEKPYREPSEKKSDSYSSVSFKEIWDKNQKTIDETDIEENCDDDEEEFSVSSF